jgi:DNA-binding transcriptional LysR family regulator
MDFAIEGEFPAILRDFRQRYPAVDVISTASFTDRILEDLACGKVDIGFVVGPVAHAELNARPVQWERFAAVVPDGHRLAGKDSIELKELAEEPFILGRAERWAPYIRRVEDLCGRAGFSPNVVQEADTTPSIFAFVGSGMGVTLYVERAFRFNPPGTKVLRLDGVDTAISTEVAWRRDDRRAVVKNFLAGCASAPLPAGAAALE